MLAEAFWFKARPDSDCFDLRTAIEIVADIARHVPLHEVIRARRIKARHVMVARRVFCEAFGVEYNHYAEPVHDIASRADEYLAAVYLA